MDDLIQQPVISHDIINISRCPPTTFQLKVIPMSRGGLKYLLFSGSDTLVGGMMAVTVTASHLINKHSFQKTTGTGTETWVRSWIAGMPTAIEWSRLTSVLSEVVDVAGLVFPTLGQGVTLGPSTVVSIILSRFFYI